MFDFELLVQSFGRGIAAGLLLWARSDIDRLLHGLRSSPNASSVVLSAVVGS